MDGRTFQALRLALSSVGFCLALALPASAQVIEIGPEGVSTVSGPAVVTLDGVTPIKVERVAPASSKQAAAAPLLESAGDAADLSPRLLEAIAYVESRFNTKAISPKGAVGMMQLMPGTAAELGVNPHNPEENARGGADYLRRMVTLF